MVPERLSGTTFGGLRLGISHPGCLLALKPTRVRDFKMITQKINLGNKIKNLDGLRKSHGAGFRNLFVETSPNRAKVRTGCVSPAYHETIRESEPAANIVTEYKCHFAGNF